MTESIILDSLRKHFRVTGRLERYDSYDDLIFAVEATERKYILKIYHEKHSETGLRMQMKLMDIMAAGQNKYEIPAAILSVNGETMPLIEGRYMTLHPFMSGKMLGLAKPILPQTRVSLGRMLGNLQKLIFGTRLEGDYFKSKWDNAHADWIGSELHHFRGEEKRIILKVHQEYLDQKDQLDLLRKSIIHNDANEYNLFVKPNAKGKYVITGVIDFGDSVYSYLINDIAIAAAYAVMGLPDPLDGVADIIKGFHKVFPLEENEIEYLFLLIKVRLIISYTHSTISAKKNPNNEYIEIHKKPVIDLLQKLDKINERLAHFTFRLACGWEPLPNRKALINAIRAQTFHPLFGEKVSKQNAEILDLSLESKYIGNMDRMTDTAQFSKEVFAFINALGKKYGIGRYDEIRLLYNAASFAHESNNGPVWRTLHIGLDVFSPAGTPLYAPLSGKVVVASKNDLPKDYGHVIILEHELEKGIRFYTLYGHLSAKSIKHIKVGQSIARGEVFAWLGEHYENGDWVPHVHFQIIADLLGEDQNFVGVADPHLRELWISICPDPNIILGIDMEREDYYKIASADQLMARRNKVLPNNLSVSFPDDPLIILRGKGQFLFDQHAQAYLDTVNNVAHVGHENWDVVAAGQGQMSVLNTNTRYLHPSVIEYAEALLDTLPDHLEVVYFCNSGSEANDLALRIAKTVTGNEKLVILEQGYHGHTQSCIDVSSYKFEGKGGFRKKDNVIKALMPDPYRGQFNDDSQSYLDDLKNRLKENNHTAEIAAFIGEAILSCGGQIVPPDSYYKGLYKLIKKGGGLFIADEVQTGFGRVGSHFWAFQLHGIDPDIVTLGKPMGNGHPLAAVVTTREVADQFANGMEYFNTFAGNPVSCAIGLTVLEYIQKNQLQNNARIMGQFLIDGLRNLQKVNRCLGDIRGHGLFLGVELVDDPVSRTPSPQKADYLVCRMKDLNVQMSTDGPDLNVIKIKPPLTFNLENGKYLLSSLSKVLAEDFMQI